MCTVFCLTAMSFSVLLCFLVTTLISFCSTMSSEARYECGPHGKFEYCIDGIPGCVIGCHCHPGYYFDTDTKICEPNLKLTQDFRRHYLVAEPTRVHAPPQYTPTVTDSIPTPTSTDKFDGTVNEIAKDTDDLGDWLYNQFFKTIENQVISNANNSKTKPKTDTDDSNIQAKRPTRRSGGSSERVITKPRRKTRKSMKTRKKKKHTKVHGLRRKLLRITEDDSLFDSESDSDSDSSDSDSGDSDSESDTDTSGDDTSGDTSGSSDGKKSQDDKDHGHKKVIIFNKRPKPPLPSFIFLPSMDTPYYPPIGLPPPPPMPMYPMVPVPPMAPGFPMFPFPGPPNCNEGSNATTTTTTTAASSTDKSTSTTETNDENKDPSPDTPSDSPPDVPPDPSPDPTPDSPNDSNPETSPKDEPPPGRLRLSDRRTRLDKHRIKNPKPIVLRSKEPGTQGKMRHGPRNKLMQKQKQMILNQLKKSRRHKPATDDEPLEEPPEGELPDIDDVANSEETFIPPDKLPKKKIGKKFPKLEDVDFKYLSELIHRMNQSDIRERLPPLPFDLNDDLKELQKIIPQQTRRNFNPYNIEQNIPHQPNEQRTLHREGSDDIYYSNLGRQIAAMIRNAGSKADQVVHKDTEQAHHTPQVPFHSVLNENSFAPRSFWERSVRSPLNQIGGFSNYLDESRTLKHTNDKNLLNLENEVQIFATTASPLTLRDLENILNAMQNMQAQVTYREPIPSTKQSNASLNVNLLPKYERPDNIQRRLYEVPVVPHDLEYVTEHYKNLLPPKWFMELQPLNVTNTTVLHKPVRNVNLPFSDYWILNNNQNIQERSGPPRPVFFGPTNNSQAIVVGNDNFYSTKKPSAQPYAPLVRTNKNISMKPGVEYLQFLRSMPVVKYTAAKRPEPKFLTNSPVVDFHRLNYFSGNKHHYMFEAASYPLSITPFKRQISKPFGKSLNPSYFHHALHHFDYF